MEWLDLDILKNFLGEAISSQVAQWTLGLAIASIIHSGRVKKEIKLQFAQLTDAIRELGSALRQDLNAHSDRIGAVEKSVSQLSERIDGIENKH